MVFILATIPQYIPPLCWGTIRIPLKMLNVYILRRLFNVVCVTFRKYIAKYKYLSFIEKKTEDYYKFYQGTTRSEGNKASRKGM